MWNQNCTNHISPANFIYITDVYFTPLLIYAFNALQLSLHNTVSLFWNPVCIRRIKNFLHCTWYKPFKIFPGMSFVTFIYLFTCLFIHSFFHLSIISFIHPPIHDLFPQHLFWFHAWTNNATKLEIITVKINKLGVLVNFLNTVSHKVINSFFRYS